MYVIRPIDVLNTPTYSAFLVHDCEVRDDRHRRRDHELCGAVTMGRSRFVYQAGDIDGRTLHFQVNTQVRSSPG